jgi:hypothetical protein
MKLLFPIVLMAAWAAMVALTMADFAGFYAAVHAAEMPVVQATEMLNVVGKPKRRVRTASDCVRSYSEPTHALHD